MLTYAAGETLAHRMDPRTKLAAQAAFAAAAFANTTPEGLVGLSAVVAGMFAGGRVPPRWALRELRYVLPFLVAAPVVTAVTLGPPWVDLAAARAPGLAAARTLLVLLVAAAYVRTTPVRDTRAAIQRHVPGRPGQFLGAGTAIVLRYLALLEGDLRGLRDAMRARLAEERPLRDRVRLVAVGGLNRSFERSDRLALALRARCFAWNPTLPALRFGRVDLPGWLLVVGLVSYALV